MTASAWWMLILTWTVIIFFTGKFFIKVVKNPGKGGEE